MPVTHGVAGSSPVRTARNKKPLVHCESKAFLFFQFRNQDLPMGNARILIFRLCLYLCMPANCYERPSIQARKWQKQKNKEITTIGIQIKQKDLKEKSFRSFCGQWWIRTTEVERQLSYSQPHLATLVTAHSNTFFWASCRIRTNDPEITNHVLWPTELKRRYF